MKNNVDLEKYVKGRKKGEVAYALVGTDCIYIFMKSIIFGSFLATCIKSIVTSELFSSISKAALMSRARPHLEQNFVVGEFITLHRVHFFGLI